MKIRGALHEFKVFVLKGQVLDFVMAVVLGGAIGRIITASVDGIVMPTVASWMRDSQWEHWTLWRWRIGPVLSAFMDFAAKAAVMYILFTKGVAFLLRTEPVPQPQEPLCPYCRETIHPEATRCGHCCSLLPGKDVPGWGPPAGSG